MASSNITKKEIQEYYEKKLNCMCQQLNDYHKAYESMQQDLESTRGRLSCACREQDELKRSINQKDEAIICLESEVDRIRFELKEKETTFQRQFDALQDKLSAACEQVQHKDSALSVCQSEIKNHVNNMEEVKDSLMCDLKQKESLICQMREGLQQVYDDLKCKTDDNAALVRTIVDLKSKLAQSTSHCGELENKVSFLQEKIPQLESQFTKEKHQAVMEMDDYEKKLCATQNDLSCATGETRKLRRMLQEKDEELSMMSSEKDNVCRELDREKDEATLLGERIDTLEADNREICRLLQMKIKSLKELEQSLCLREKELENCKECVEELNAKIREFNTGVTSNENDDTGAQLIMCRDALAKCENERKDLEKKLQYAVQEMEKLAKEVKKLRCELDEARSDICDRDAMIVDLEQTLERAKADMEQRLCRVDQQLERYEKEVKDKTHMLAETGDKCCRFQEVVAEKNAEIEQLDTKLSRACSEMECLRAQIKELEDAKTCLQASINEEKCHNAEFCQEIKRARDQLNAVSQELSTAKRDLCNCYRDTDSRLKENTDLRHRVQEQDCVIHRLNEEKACMCSKLSSMQCRMDDDIKMMTQKLSETKSRHECEMSNLKQQLCDLEECYNTVNQKLSSKERHLIQMEKTHYQKVDNLTRENNNLLTKLQEKDAQLSSTKDCLTLKDAEIMRMKHHRVCSNDRCNSNKGLTGCGNSMFGSNKVACSLMNDGLMSSGSCIVPGPGGGGGGGGSGSGGSCRTSPSYGCCSSSGRSSKRRAKSCDNRLMSSWQGKTY